MKHKAFKTNLHAGCSKGNPAHSGFITVQYKYAGS